MSGAKFLLGKVFLLAAVTAGSAAAQAPQLVEVSLTNIKATIAKEIQISVEKVPLMIKVPAETAKKVCNVTAEGLMPHANSGVPSCPADKTSAELNDAVKKEIAKSGNSK